VQQRPAPRSALSSPTDSRPPELDDFYEPVGDRRDWQQGDIFRATTGSLERSNEIAWADPTEGALYCRLAVLNGSPELWANERGVGLAMLVSHTCDFSEKYRRDGRRGQPLLFAPVVPLSFLGDRNGEIAWQYSRANAMKHVLPLPPAPPNLQDRAVVLFRFITAIQPDDVEPPVIGLSLRERRRLRQQLARFFSRIDEDLAQIGAAEDAYYGLPGQQP